MHHGFDLARLDPAAVDGAVVRRELGLDGKLAFGAIGRLYALKNYPALLEAFAVGLEGVGDARLVIAGAGDVAPLAREAERLGIGEQARVRRPARRTCQSCWRRWTRSCTRRSPSRSGW